MSIRIQDNKCIGCRRCIEVCPGNLIKWDAVESHAYMRRPKDCWGCTSCIKECPVNAIAFFLGVDMGGNGTELTVSEKDGISIWNFTASDGSSRQLEVNKRDANKY